MGASNFHNSRFGTNPEEVFRQVVNSVSCDCSDDDEGYSGTIIEKPGFVMLTKPEGKNLKEFINEQTDLNDKWEPAFCVEEKVGDKIKYHFFGMAPS